MTTRYTTLHNDWDPNLVIPFVVTRHKADKVYQEPVWGLAITRVTADGKDVPAAKHMALMDDLNFGTVPIGDAPLVYLVRRADLVFAKTLDEKLNFELVKYTLPADAKQVTIEYRLRESPTSLGPAVKLESTRV